MAHPSSVTLVISTEAVGEVCNVHISSCHLSLQDLIGNIFVKMCQAYILFSSNRCDAFIKFKYLFAFTFFPY